MVKIQYKIILICCWCKFFGYRHPCFNLSPNEVRPRIKFQVSQVYVRNEYAVLYNIKYTNKLSVLLILKQGCTNLGRQVGQTTKFCMLLLNICGVPTTKLPSCHHASTYNFEVATRFLRKTCTPVLKNIDIIILPLVLEVCKL